MQIRTVVKLQVEVNLLNTFTNKPKPAGLNVREVALEINDIHRRLVNLNDKIAKAYGTDRKS